MNLSLGGEKKCRRQLRRRAFWWRMPPGWPVDHDHLHLSSALWYNRESHDLIAFPQHSSVEFHKILDLETVIEVMVFSNSFTNICSDNPFQIQVFPLVSPLLLIANDFWVICCHRKRFIPLRSIIVLSCCSRNLYDRLYPHRELDDWKSWKWKRSSSLSCNFSGNPRVQFRWQLCHY